MAATESAPAPKIDMDKSLTSVAALWLGAEPPEPPAPERDVDIEYADEDDQVSVFFHFSFWFRESREPTQLPNATT